MSEGKFRIKFRGVRGSHPIPSENMLKYGGNTSCVEIRVNGHLIIIDAGTGLISLGNDLIKSYIASGSTDQNRKPIQATIIFSHTHHDHIQGFPFFKPAYMSSSKIYMYGPKTLGMDFAETLSQSMFTPFFPIDLGEMDAQLFINNFKETEMIVFYKDNPVPELRKVHSEDDADIPADAVTVTSLKSYSHPKDGVLLFRISWAGKSVVYASDKESYIGGDNRLTSFARNTDVLIHDAQYLSEDYTSQVAPKQGYGHSTPEMAVEAANHTNAGQLVLYHLDPAYDDKTISSMEENAKKQFYNCIAAYEGLEIDLV